MKVKMKTILLVCLLMCACSGGDTTSEAAEPSTNETYHYPTSDRDMTSECDRDITHIIKTSTGTFIIHEPILCAINSNIDKGDPPDYKLLETINNPNENTSNVKYAEPRRGDRAAHER